MISAKQIIIQVRKTKAYNVINGDKINHQLNLIAPVPFNIANIKEDNVQIIRDAFEKYIIFLFGVIIRLILYDIRISLLIRHHQVEL